MTAARPPRALAETEERGSWFAHTVPTQALHALLEFPAKLLNLFGERGGTRTLDPMIKSHVLYRLSYALTRGLCRGMDPRGSIADR